MIIVEFKYVKKSKSDDFQESYGKFWFSNQKSTRQVGKMGITFWDVIWFQNQKDIW